MRETNEQPDMIHIAVTKRAAEFYALLLTRLGGNPNGPRKEIATDVLDQLEVQGVTFSGLPKYLELREYFNRGQDPVLPYLAERWPEAVRERKGTK